MTSAAILGPRSMLGEALQRILATQGAEVIAIGRAPGDCIALDLGAPPGQVQTGLRADVLFHCASEFGADDPPGIAANLRTNTSSCAQVLEVAERLGCRQIVYAGSVSSIEGADSAGLGSYGLSKALAEQVLAWGMQRIGGGFCSLRLAQLYDTHGRCCTRQPWFGRIVGYAARGLDLRMPASQGERNFVHVDDAARIMASAARRHLTGTWPLCADESLTPARIAELAYGEFGRGGKPSVDPTKAPFRPMHFPDARALFERLGEPGCRPLEAGLADIVRAGTGERFGPVDVAA